MLSKLAVAFVATLAATAQAGHVKHHHFAKRHYSDNSTSVNQLATTLTLVPTPLSSSASQLGTGIPTVTLVPTPSGSGSGSVPLSTGPSATVGQSSSITLDHSSLVPLGTGPSASIARSSSAPLDYSSSVPLGTGPSAQQSALSRTSSIYHSTGPSASLYPSSLLSASLNPSSTVPLGTGPKSSVTQQATSTGPHGSVITEVPTKISIVTSDSVLTYTIGSGSSTTVVVTTVRRTSTQTVFQVNIECKEIPIAFDNEQLNRQSIRHRHQPHSMLQMSFLTRTVQPLPSALSLRPPPLSPSILFPLALLVRTIISLSRLMWLSAPPQLP